jgi:hypothetical protein
MNAKTEKKTKDQKDQMTADLVSKMTPHQKLEFVFSLIATSDKKLPMEDGRLYMMVQERIRLFRLVFGFNVRIDSFPKEINAQHALFECQLWIRVEDGEKGTWEFVQRSHAYQEKNSSVINMTSYVENAETSAIGRCLSFMGASGGDSISSAEDLVLALEDAKAPKQTNTTKGQNSGTRIQRATPASSVNRSAGKAPEKVVPISKETLEAIEAYLSKSNNKALRAITINSLKRLDGGAVTRFEEITETEGQGVLKKFELLEEDPELL